MTPTNWAALGFFLNVVWFAYAMLNTRYLRKHVEKVEQNILNACPVFWAYRLMQYGEKQRDHTLTALAGEIHTRLILPPKEQVVDSGYHYCPECNKQLVKGDIPNVYYCVNELCTRQGKLWIKV